MRSTSGNPVPGCWSIRPTGPSAAAASSRLSGQILSPAPVTTIAWRLSHLAVGCFGLRASHHFGDGSLTHQNAERPLTAKEGVAYFKEQACSRACTSNGWTKKGCRAWRASRSRTFLPDGVGRPACQPGGTPPPGGGIPAAGPLPGDWARETRNFRGQYPRRPTAALTSSPPRPTTATSSATGTRTGCPLTRQDCDTSRPAPP